MTNTNRALSQAHTYYRRGIPSLLPDTNRYKRMAERHRWGHHGQGELCPEGCPARP